MRYFIVAVLGVIGFGALYGQPTGRLNPNDVRVQVAGDEFTVAEMERRYGTDYELTRRSAEGVPNASVEDLILEYRYGEVATFWFLERSEDQRRWLASWNVTAEFALGREFAWIFEINREELHRRLGPPRSQEYIDADIYPVENGTVRFHFNQGNSVTRIRWLGAY